MVDGTNPEDPTPDAAPPDAAPPDAAPPDAAPPDAAPPDAPPSTPAVVEVRLLDLPLRQRARLSVHVEGVLREFALIQLGQGQHLGGSLPARLLELAVDLDTTYAPYRAANAAAMEEAFAAGEEFFDAVYQAPVASAAWVRHLSEVLEEADEFCREGTHLLTPPPAAEVVAFRRWLFGQIVQQLAGNAPVPWLSSLEHTAGHMAQSASGNDLSPTSTSPAPTSLDPLSVAGLVDPTGSASVTADGPEPTGAGDDPVVGQPLVLEPVPSAVASARRYVRATLVDLAVPELEDSAELALSELVTNVVLHARTAFTLTVRALRAGGVRVEVTDSSPLPVITRRYGLNATTGRGLQVVSAVCSAWGIQALPPGAGLGKCVWFQPRAGADVVGHGGAEDVMALL